MGSRAAVCHAARVTARPPARWCHASTGLEDFALITWTADPERVGALLPDGFVPDLRGGQALVSMVPFIDRRFHFRFAPFVPVDCGQINYRTYVRRGNETGVWFFATSLDSVFVVLPRVLWRMPWHRTRLRVTAAWEGDSCRSWRVQAEGWGRAAVALRGTGRSLRLVDGFADEEEASRILRDPFVGWYGRRDGSGVGRYSVWHEPLRLEEAEVDEAECTVLTDLGLIDPGQLPLCAGVQRRVAFDVHTPPVRE